MMSRYLLFIIFLGIVTSSCAPTLNVRKISLDKAKGYYTYKTQGTRKALRFDSKELVTSSNIDSFLTILSQRSMIYNYPQLIENDNIISADDRILVTLYSSACNRIESNDPSNALYFLNELSKNYNDIKYFSDVLFLEGVCWELLENKDSARIAYTNFLTFSDKKYSSRYRGYTNYSGVDSCFLEEKRYATAFLQNNTTRQPVECFTPITPKYYYQSFSEGYVINSDEFDKDNKFIHGVSVYTNSWEKMKIGYGITRLISENRLAYGNILYSSTSISGTFAYSQSLIKTVDDRFGCKISGFLTYENLYNQKVFNFYPGSTISFGYHINTRLYLGCSVYYIADLLEVNKNLKFTSSQGYSVALYYQLIKGISLKTGIDNNWPVIGLSITGSSLDFSFENSSFGLFQSVY